MEITVKTEESAQSAACADAGAACSMTGTYESAGERETFELGMRFGKAALPGQVYVLEGDLGAGKTVFAKGFAAGLGITEPVTSPTFTIVKEYDGGRLPLYHMDVYRIGDVDEMEEVGAEEMFSAGGVCLIEWGSMIRDILPEDALWVRIERDAPDQFDHRAITCTAGEKAAF